MQVPFVNVAAQFNKLEDDLVDIFKNVGQSGMYVMGDACQEFEQALAEMFQVQHCHVVGNGTDALILALKAFDIGVGDDVITTPNSFIASAGAIAAVGANIRFIDVGDDFNIDVSQLVKTITPNTKAIIAVHLTGNPADIDAIKKITDPLGIKIIEDAAQAIDATYKGRKVGSLGDVACFSLHPLKNFHLMGDAGFITSNNNDLMNKVGLLKNHGLINRDESSRWGLNSRCDTLQAAIGLYKLPFLSQWTARFKEVAERYIKGLQEYVQCPLWSPVNDPVFHNFVIQVKERDLLMDYLTQQGIGCKIHYPIPLHLMSAAQGLGYGVDDFPLCEYQAKHILSLPIYPELTDVQVDYVINNVISFFQSKRG